MKTIKNDQGNIKRPIVWLTLTGYFIYFAVLRYFIIPFGDDQFWWGKMGQFLLEHHFFVQTDMQQVGGSSNGRYLSNLLVIYTMHHPIYQILIYAMFSTTIVYLLYKLVDSSAIIFVLALLLPFTLDVHFSTLTWYWYAAFVNYIVGLTFVLLYILVLKNQLLDRKKYSGSNYIVCFFLIALVGGLFVEHLTIYQILLGLFPLVLSKIKKLKLKANGFNYAYLAGAIIAAVIMFSNKSYYVKDDYRSSSITIQGLIQNYATMSHFWLVTNNLVLIALITIAVTIYLLQKPQKRLFDYLQISVSLAFLIYYAIINFLLPNRGENGQFIPLNVSPDLLNLDTVISVMFIAYLLVSIFCMASVRFKISLAFCLVSFGILILPFMLIFRPISSREFFDGIIFLYLYSFLIIRRIHFSSLVVKVVVLMLALVLIGSASVTMYANIENYDVYLPQTQENYYPGPVAKNQQVPYPQYMPNSDLYNTTDGKLYWKYYNKTPLPKRLFNLDY